MKHVVFGELVLNKGKEEYETKKILSFGEKREEITITLSETFGSGGVEDGHIKAYLALMENWDRVTSDVLNAVIKYQNENWGNTAHTSSFNQFETEQDVLDNTKLFGIQIETQSPDNKDDRYVVLLFSAEWVNDDYRILSVALLKLFQVLYRPDAQAVSKNFHRGVIIGCPSGFGGEGRGGGKA